MVPRRHRRTQPARVSGPPGSVGVTFCASATVLLVRCERGVSMMGVMPLDAAACASWAVLSPAARKTAGSEPHQRSIVGRWLDHSFQVCPPVTGVSEVTTSSAFWAACMRQAVRAAA